MTEFKTLRVIDHASFAKLNDAEKLLFSGLQGLANRGPLGIYCIVDNFNGLFFTPDAAQLWLDRLPGDKTSVTDCWALLNETDAHGRRYILCDLKTAPDSANIATTLAGLLDALPADISLKPKLDALGFSLRLDVRKWTYAQMLQSYAGKFNTAFAVELNTDFAHKKGVAWGPRDYAIANRAIVLFGAEARAMAMQSLSPDGTLYGWGPIPQGGSEYEFIFDTGSHGLPYVAADAACNLSVFSRIDEKAKPVPAAAASPTLLEPGTKYVAFLMSDGDNLQWLLNRGNFRGWWGSPLRGSFPIGWTMAPSLHALAPTVWNYYIDSLTDQDEIVCGASGIGYVFDNIAASTGFPEFLRRTERFLKTAAVTSVAAFGNTYPNKTYLRGYVDKTSANGVFYTSFRPWVVPPEPETYIFGGKAIVPMAVDFNGNAEDATNVILAESHHPPVYLVYVNAWGNNCDPMTATRALYDMLMTTPGIKVVKPSDLFRIVCG